MQAATGQEPKSAPGRGFDRLALLAPTVLYVLLRVPTWFEPRWYTDESGYASTAWMTLHGKVLYLSAWNNKPPVLFWIYDAALRWFGPSETALHIFSTLAGLLAVAGVWLLARQALGSRRALAAGLLVAILIGTPAFNGDLALPENFLIAPTIWGMVAIFAASRSDRGRAQWWGALAGALFGVGMLIQQTVLADFLAAAMTLVFVSPKRFWRPVLALAVTAALVVGLVLTPYVVRAGLHNVSFYLVTSFAGYTSGTLHPSVGSLMPRAIALALLVAGTLLLRKRASFFHLLMWVWLGALLLAYVIPNRPYIHFLLPACVPAALLLASIELGSYRRILAGAGARWAPLLASVGLSAVLWTMVIGSNLTTGSLFTFKLAAEYYPVFVGRATGAIGHAQFVKAYNPAAASEDQAAAWLRRHGLAGATAVVWSPDAWVYLTTPLRSMLPAGPIYVDQFWMGTTSLYHRVESMQPEVFIATAGYYNTLGPLSRFLQERYRQVARYPYAKLWVRADLAAKLPQ